MKAVKVLVLVIASAGIIVAVKMKIETNKTIEGLTFKVDDCASTTGNYLKIFEAQWKLSGKKLDTNVHVYDDKKIEQLLFPDDELSPYFILYFEWDQCQDCIAQELSHFSEIEDRLPVKVVISFDSFAGFLAYSSSWSYPYPLYYLPKDKFLYEGVKYAFGVHTFVANHGRISDAHIGSASHPELSDIYYKTLSDKYATY